eukprot:3049762-Pyramimonas_sp.AAC.1
MWAHTLGPFGGAPLWCHSPRSGCAKTRILDAPTWATGGAPLWGHDSREGRAEVRGGPHVDAPTGAVGGVPMRPRFS